MRGPRLLLRNAWIGTLLLASPGLLLFAVGWNFSRSRPGLSLGLFFTMQHALRLWLLAAVGVLLLAFAFRFLLQRRRQPIGQRASLPALALPFVLGLAALGYCGYVAWEQQIFQPLLGDVADVRRIDALRKASLDSQAPPEPTPDWPQWRGPRRDGRAEDQGLHLDWDEQPPKVLWRAPIHGGFSSLAIARGRVYTLDRLGNDERIVCLAVEDGKELWSHAWPADYASIDSTYREGPRATPTVHDGHVYAVGATGILTCLELGSDGSKPRLAWQRDLMAEFDAQPPRWGVACSPLVEDELVITQPGGKQGSVVAHHRLTGDVVWTCRADGSGYSSPVLATLAGERQVVAATATALVGIRPSDGRELWSYRWVTDYFANVASPVVAGNYVFYSSGYGKGCVLLEIERQGESLEAKPVYVKNNKLMRCHHSTCVLHDGHIYGCDSGAHVLKCIDLRTAEERWTSRAPSNKTTCIYADGHLLVLSEEGVLASIAADASACKIKGKLTLFGDDASRVWALPALADGKLYVRGPSEVTCLDLRK